MLATGLTAVPGWRAEGEPSPPTAAAQTVRLRSQTAFHADPDGTYLGTLQAGLEVEAGRSQGGWRQVTFEGWIFTASTGPSPRAEFTLAVAASGGENVRAEPDGDLVARAVEGAGFVRVGRRGGWTHVKRTAWVRANALPAPPRATPRAETPANQQAAPQPAAPPPAAPVSPPAPQGDRVLVRRGASLSVAPGGAAVGTLPEAVPGEVVDRSGNWVRVRTETWVRAEDVEAAPADSNVVTLERLRAEPDKYVGRAVSWRLQFLSVRTADELRPELPLGQPYLLTRGPLPEVGFVYVVVTAEQARRFQAMSPLDEFVATGVIRASRLKYLPTPVLELQR